MSEVLCVKKPQQLADMVNVWNLSENARGLIEAEKQIPVEIYEDKSLRAKITDVCGMTCVFCHNEGTPVAVAALCRARGQTYNGGRMSCFEDTNGCDFIPSEIPVDETFAQCLGALRRSLDLDELHLTGGEPTLHRNLADLISIAKSRGFSVKMTSNGENGTRVLESCVQHGLEKVNFSIFGTTPVELAEVQATRFRDGKLAARKIDALKSSIETAVANDLKVDANIVMRNSDDAERVLRILNEYNAKLNVRILNDLNFGEESENAIYDFLAEIGAIPAKLHLTAGVSGSRVDYVLPDLREVSFKQIRRAVLPRTCANCKFYPENCDEGFYGTRLYRDLDGNYKVGICIQRMDLTRNLDDFLASNLPREIREFRAQELGEMYEFFGERIVE